jgi:uncharacterized phage-like protein YoqJ
VKIAITGHRPEKIPDPAEVDRALGYVFRKLQPELLYQGMAAGVDLWSALVAYRLNIPYVACKPWAGHTPRAEDREFYEKTLEHAFEVVNVSPEENYLGPWMYHKRNEYMVDHADVVVAVWDGGSSGGTAACVRYAVKQKKRIVQVDPIKRVVTGLDELLAELNA